MSRAPYYEPAEDTDLLLSALAREPLRGARACEVGPGSGVVARAMLDAGAASVVAVDINPAAVAATRALAGPIALRGDLLAALRGPFDLVAFNAPYLPSSDDERLPGAIDQAFHGGDEGVEVSEAFVRDLPRVLARPAGRALLVVSSRANLERLARCVADAGLRRDIVATARFFFEEIAVWRLTRASAASGPIPE